MSGPTSAMYSELDPGKKRSSDAIRLLGTTLAPTLLGERVQMDFYARNGFRFLSVPAWLEQDALAVKCQEFRNLARLDLARARRASIGTVPDEHLDSTSILSAVAKLESPRHRFFGELFWPHVAETEFGRIRDVARLGSERLIPVFHQKGKSGPARSHHLHTRALVYHCLAIEAEFDYLDKRSPSPGKHWESAITAWRELWMDDEFWTYLRSRVTKLDDPRLRAEDVEKARRELPGLILGLQDQFAERYVEAGDFAQCKRHLKLIRTSGFPGEIVLEATLSAVKRVAGNKLEDLHRRAKQAFAGISKPVNRGAFETVAGPLLQEAQGVRELLVERLELPADLLQQSAFNDFAEAVKQATTSKILYEGTERERNILYSSLFVKRLLALPLSPLVRQQMEQTIQEDNRILYSRFGMDSGFPQAMECVFLKGAEADPDDSIVVPMHRITRREVQVDKARGTMGINVLFDKGRLLVPRSKQAKLSHGGVANVDVPPSEYTAAQRSVAEQLKSLEKSRLILQADMAGQRDAELNAAAARQAAEEKEKAKRFNSRSEEAAASIARLDAAEQAATGTETAALESTTRKVKAKYEPALKQKRMDSDRMQGSVKGFAGAVKVELPAAIVIFLGMSLLIGFGVGAVIAALIAAIVGALLFGKGMRSFLTVRALRPLRIVEMQRDQELANLQQQSERRMEQVRSELAGKRKQWQAELDAVAREQQGLQDARKKILSAIRQGWDDRITSAVREHEQKLQPLKAQLVRSVQVLKQSDQKEFAPYKLARTKGFVDGEEPTGSAMQMTANEKAQAIAMLRL